MRVPTQERRSFRLRAWIIALVVILIILLFSLRGLAGFYTTYLWFSSLGQGSTWGELLAAKVVPAVVFTVVFFVIMLANLLIADRLAPKVRPMGPVSPEEELVSRYQQVTGRYQGRIRVGVSIFFALIAGIGVSSQWRNWILFTHRVNFGIKDPQFHKDIGFYIFTLPFLRFILDWLFAGLVIVLLVTAVAHYLNGGIRFQSPTQRTTPQVKAHLSVIVAVMALVKTAEYYFARFGLTTSSRGVVDGATYTDVHAQLPAYNLLIFISIVAAGLFIWNIWRRGWVLPVIAVGLWGFVSIAVGTIYPAGVQSLKVKPNELALERPYIARNISGTRDAYDVNSVQVQNFNYNQNLQPGVVSANLPTIDNARLWDPDVIQATYQTLQGLQPYYRINNVDIDRYDINGQETQVLIGVRDLNSSSLPSQSWVNEHLVYTHGYGAIVSPTNQAASSGDPLFNLSQIPPSGTIPLTNQGAQVYFGENLSGYEIVDAKQPEFNYAKANNTNATTRYTGTDGVKLSNIFRRAAFALRFGDINPLISGQVTSSSKLLMIRDIMSRVQTLAPFLSFDSDPYPVVVNGRINWILDGYTTSDQYPYSETYSGEGGLSGNVNYVRNSVKATIDAYNGTVHFYVVDEKDPIIEAYRKAFPHLFTDGSKMPAAIRAHLRYPENLFQLQSNVFSKYHVTNVSSFYAGTERWLLSPDPNAVLGQTVTPTTTRGASGRAPQISATTPRQQPYYLYIRLPGDTHENFLILQPFVPVSINNQQTRLVSFMTAKSDPGSYGQLQAFVMPQGTNVIGPVQVANNIQSDTALSQQFTLLSQGGSEVVKGNIQLIPVGNSLVYVQPIFVQSSSNGYPQFRFVVVFIQGKNPVYDSTVNAALNDLFNGGVSQSNSPTVTPSTSPTAPPTPSSSSSTVQNLLNQAAQEFASANAALRNGDLSTYQADIAAAQQDVAQAQQALAAGK